MLIVGIIRNDKRENAERKVVLGFADTSSDVVVYQFWTRRRLRSLQKAIGFCECLQI